MSLLGHLTPRTGSEEFLAAILIELRELRALLEQQGAQPASTPAAPEKAPARKKPVAKRSAK